MNFLSADIGVVLDVTRLLGQFITSWVPYVLGALLYIFFVVALWRISARRKVSKRWLAVLPVGNVWLLGSIADHYRQTKGQKKNRRLVLVILSAVMNLLILALAVTALWMTIEVINRAPSISVSNEQLLEISEMTAGEQAEYFLEMMIKSVTSEPGLVEYIYQSASILCIMAVVVLAVDIAAFAVSRVAVYDVIASCEPRKAVWMTILSILVPPAMPVMLLMVYKHDMGLQLPQGKMKK